MRPNAAFSSLTASAKQLTQSSTLWKSRGWCSDGSDPFLQHHRGFFAKEVPCHAGLRGAERLAHRVGHLRLDIHGRHCRSSVPEWPRAFDGSPIRFASSARSASQSRRYDIDWCYSDRASRRRCQSDERILGCDVAGFMFADNEATADGIEYCLKFCSLSEFSQ